MHSIKVFSVILILSLCSSDKAQKTHLIELQIEHSIDSFDFSFNEVIDARLFSENIGIVQKGMSNKRVKAQIKGGVKPSLTLLTIKLVSEYLLKR